MNIENMRTHTTMRFMVDGRRRLRKKEFDVLSAAIATGRTAYSAATGSPQPLKMSAQAVSLKRAREDFERGGRARRG
jgi:hypothetical protein